jgi:hypothetical protein
MSNKEKDPLEKQSDLRSFGLNVGPSDLEPGMRY